MRTAFRKATPAMIVASVLLVGACSSVSTDEFNQLRSDVAALKSETQAARSESARAAQQAQAAAAEAKAAAAEAKRAADAATAARESSDRMFQKGLRK